MSDTDIVREVDEELRREQLEKIWKLYGNYFLLAAAIVVLMVAGYKGWQAYTIHQAEASGSAFDKAVSLAQEGKLDEAQQALAKIADKGSGAYANLASLRLAAEAAKNGKTDDALAQFDAVGKQSSAPKALQDYARIQAAQLRIDSADFTEMQNRLNDLAAPNSPWRSSARELLGLSAYKAGKLSEATDYFAQILSDKDARGPVGQIAEMMQQMILAAEANKPSEPAKTVAPATPAAAGGTSKTN
jgi:hypothetical protein